jgi:hypothetical protein
MARIQKTQALQKLHVQNAGEPEWLFSSQESSLPDSVTQGPSRAPTGAIEQNGARRGHLSFAFQSTLCSVDSMIARALPPPLPAAKNPMAGWARGVSALRPCTRHNAAHNRQVT